MEALMFRSRVDQALTHRRRALHKLRIGDRIGFLKEMDGAKFFLKLAREWKAKQ